MPRDTGGIYTLPGGSFTPSTIIQSAVMNSKFLDLTAAMTDSLSRSGDGGMLAPLKLPDGSASFPTLTFENDASTGFYLAASNTFRATILASTVQEWSNTGVAINKPLTLTGALALAGGLTQTGGGAAALSGTLSVTGAVTTAAGLTATNSTTNGAAGTFTGNGTGAGLTATGGSGGANGVNATGTGAGQGLFGTGGASAGAGVRGVGGAGGVGGTFTGTGNHGATFSSSSAGAGFVATGAAGNPGGYVRAGTAPTASTPQYGLYCDVGYIALDSPAGVSQASPNSNVALKNVVTPANIIKAWAMVTLPASSSPGAPATIIDAINVSSVARSSNGRDITVTFPSGGGFATSTYAGVAVWSLSYTGALPDIFNQTTTTADIRFMTISGGGAIVTASGGTLTVIFVGRQ